MERETSVRVLDGEQPGYAVLVFDKQIDSPSLRLAIKSFQVGQGAYLGPSGAWDRSPHFFTAARVKTPRGGFGYRVGPEVVNYLLEDDHIEASTDDGLLREDGYWANATPLMMTPGGARPHTFVASSTPAAHAPPAPYSPPSAPSQPLSSPASPPPPPSPRPPIRRESRKTPGWLPPAAAAVVLLPLIVVALVPSLRCSVFGLGCEAPSDQDNDAERAAAKRARDCAAGEEAVADSCAAEATCFAPYREQFPHGVSLAQIEGLAARFAQSCAAVAENQLFASAKQCASRANACVVETCFAQYLGGHANGAHAAEARAEIAQARRACLNPPPKRAPEPRPPVVNTEPTPGPAPLKDGEYLAEARAVSECGVQKQRSLRVFVCSGKISWTHEAPLAPNQPPRPLKWEGFISGDGALQASVGGSLSYKATGQISDTARNIDMRYPDCVSPVTLTISRQLSTGCSQSR